MPLSMEVIVLLVCWGAFFVVWGVGWVYNLVKGPPSQTHRGPLIDYYSLIGVAAVFVLNRFVRIFSLDFSLHLPVWVEVIGCVLMVASTGLALWARFALGTMWSSRPESKVGHQLRTDGPYRVSRHPIYTAITGMLLGTLLASGGNGIVLLAGMVIIVRLLFKIPVEEKLMIETFGEQYLAYQQQVPQLIPGLQWFRKSK